MKHVSTSIVLLSGLALGWVAVRAGAPDHLAPDPASGVPSALPSALPAGHVTRRFAVEGMCCDGCSTRLYERLVVVEGVASAAIDFDAGLVSVLVAAGSDDALLLAALSFEKYSARPLR